MVLKSLFVHKSRIVYLWALEPTTICLVGPNSQELADPWFRVSSMNNLRSKCGLKFKRLDVKIARARKHAQKAQKKRYKVKG